MRRLLLPALLLALLLPPVAPLRAQGGPATAMSPQEIERIVKEYLLREPEVLYEALQELQRRRDAAEAERQRQLLVEHRAALVASPDDPVLGDPAGDVTLVEFMDYRCGYCRSMAPGLRALLGKDRRVRLVIKDFPILGPDSVTAARAALAAEKQGRYAELHWALLQARDLSEAAILDLARKQGLDTERLARDMRSAEVERIVERNRALAEALGISGTPAFVIGDSLIPGAAPVARLVELIAKARRSGG
jgi:protein-disulfide isomerase